MGRRLNLLLLLVLLMAFVVVEDFFKEAEQPGCQCDSHECFVAHKEKAMRGAVARARRKCEISCLIFGRRIQ